MPVRPIPPNNRSTTGRAYSWKMDRMVAYESSLERDLITLCEFDVNVRRYEEQPVRIDYVDEENVARHYTPDLLITYRSDIVPGAWMRPRLCEVKYREDLRGDWRNLRRKLKAARQYALSRGWEFQVVTEVEVRTAYLDNVRFLLPYRARPVDADNERLLQRWIAELRETTPEALLAVCRREREQRAILIPSLWRMIAVQGIWCDLGLPLTMHSRIWHVDPHVPEFAR